MSNEPKPVAVLGVGAGAPSLRLDVSEVAAAWGAGSGRGTLAVCDADEDTLTLAWQAALNALAAAGVDAAQLSGLWWGTTRPPMAEGPSHAFLSTALGLDGERTGLLCSGSPHCGMEALIAAWDAVAAGHATTALVVASDAIVPGIGTANETTTGAGAVAFVLGTPGDNGSGPAAVLSGRATRSVPAVDRYRADHDMATGDVYDGRLFREEVFLPLVVAAGRGLGETSGWALSDPDGKLGAAAAKRLGGPLVSSETRSSLGDCAAAGALLGAAGALSGQGRLGIIGYGGGRATAVAVEVLRPVPGSEAIASSLSATSAASYTEVLKARGQLVAQSDPIPMGVPPGGAAFVRGNVEMLSLQGARCRSCNVISTPPSIHPTCTGCGSGDLETVSLARAGTVQTFVINQTMPPPFQAPLPMIVLDLDDGARLMLQGVSADAEELAIGDRVGLRLRLYAVERGIPVYGYKAIRIGPQDDGSALPHAATQEVRR